MPMPIAVGQASERREAPGPMMDARRTTTLLATRRARGTRIANRRGGQQGPHSPRAGRRFPTTPAETAAESLDGA